MGRSLNQYNLTLTGVASILQPVSPLAVLRFHHVVGKVECVGEGSKHVVVDTVVRRRDGPVCTLVVAAEGLVHQGHHTQLVPVEVLKEEFCCTELGQQQKGRNNGISMIYYYYYFYLEKIGVERLRLEEASLG